VQVTNTPAPDVTEVAQVTEIPPAGVTTYGVLFGIVSFTVILLGLILEEAEYFLFSSLLCHAISDLAGQTWEATAVYF
jgi:hypothetical protein